MFFDFFKRKPKNDQVKKVESKIELPFEYLIVPGKIAVETCLSLRNDKSKNMTPVILGTTDSIKCLIDAYGYDENDLQSIINRAAEFNIEEFIRNRTYEEDNEFYEEVTGEWPDKSVPAIGLTAYADVLTGKPFKEVYIGLVPTNKSYEVPAYLKYGNWNDCPGPEDHVGILRYWFEKYGAEIISITSDTIECIVENPPRTKEEAIALANEQFIYCADIVTQGAGTIHELAAALLNSKYWYFWWD